MKVLWCTHQDLDGIACGILAKLWFKKEELEVVYLANTEVDGYCDKIIGRKDVDEIYFSDLCPSEEALVKLHKAYKSKVITLDHHKSNLHANRTLGENGHVYVELDENGKMPAGVSVVYDYLRSKSEFSNCNNELLDLFVETVRSYDTYQWKTENNVFAKELQTMFAILDSNVFTEKFLARLTNPNASHLITDAEMEFVRSRISQENDSIEKIISNRKSIWDFKIGKYTVGILFYPGGIAISELGYRLIEKYPELDMVLILNMYYGSFNFRAVDGTVDATELAYPLGGGGHPRACGCPIPFQLTNDFINSVVRKLSDIIAAA